MKTVVCPLFPYFSIDYFCPLFTMVDVVHFLSLPNAWAHLQPEAAATQERRLLAVRCSTMLAGARHAGLML